MRLVLGEVETLNFENDLTGIVPASQKWIDFLDGKDDMSVEDKNGNSKTVKYEGFKNLLAYFMYTEYIRKFEARQTSAGRRLQIVDNSLHVDPSQDISAIYAKTIRRFYGLDWDEQHTAYNVSNVINSNYCNRCTYYNDVYDKYYNKINTTAERVKGTAYNYLRYANEADANNFPNWDFTHIQTQAINIFGL